MEEKTKKEIVAEAEDKVSDLTQKEKTVAKSIIEQIAVLTTLITIGSYVVMYAYKTGYYRIYNIPSACIRVNLQDYLPLLLSVVCSSLCILWYVVSLRKEKVLNRISIDGVRFVYGYILIMMIIIQSNIVRFFPLYVSFLIAFGISALTELICYIIRKKKKCKKERRLSTVEQYFALEDAVSKIFVNRYYVKTGLFLLLIAVSFAPLWGELVAIANDDYQIFKIDDVSYAVIMDYSDSIIAQKVIVENSNIAINTSSYTTFPKDGIEFEYKTFDSVTRTTKISHDTVEDIEVPAFVPDDN